MNQDALSSTSKKYSSIAEVSRALGVPMHKLKHLEKAKPDLGIMQIKGRRYYTAYDIELIKKHFSPTVKAVDEHSSVCQYNLFTNEQPSQNTDIVNKINSLISKFDIALKHLASQR